MTEKFNGIVLDIRKHSDRHNIVTLFTRRHGRVSFLSSASGGKAGKIRTARLQPLAVIEGDMNFKPNSELQKLGSFSLSVVWNELYFHPVKQVVTLFLSEFLNRLLRASMPDENLWDYIVNSLTLFDRMESGIADFHIAFMASLLSFMGIQPDYSQYHKGYVFDLRSGMFAASMPSHPDFLSPQDAGVAALLCRLNFSNVRILRLDSNTRNAIVHGLLRYYGIHYPGSASLKSLDVIHDIFHS